MEVQGQDSACFSLRRDISQTISGEEMKYANLPIPAASNNTEVEESQRFYLPAEKSTFRVIRI